MADRVRSNGGRVDLGHWGMPVQMVRDLDGNELFFNDDALTKAQSG